MAPDGSVIPFEIGTGLADITDYPVSDVWNFAIAPYWFDDKDQCWPEGATNLWVQGHGFAFTAGQALLVQTDLPGESLRQIVHLTAAGHEMVDPVFLTGGLPTPVTHIVWGPDEALTRARDLTRGLPGLDRYADQFRQYLNVHIVQPLDVEARSGHLVLSQLFQQARWERLVMSWRRFWAGSCSVATGCACTAG